MSVGFGFSVGDFIAGIQLVRDIITSLQASGGSSLEYQALASELFSLERALIEVKSLKCLQDQSDQLDALKVAATQCQHTIDRFMTKIQKYQPSLTAQGSGSKWRDSLRKVQWALCKKEDIAAFKAEVSGHAVSINLLVATAQFNASTNLGLQSLQHNKQQNETSNALAKHNTWSVAVIDSLKDVTQSCLLQGQEFLATSRSIVQSNMQIFQNVLEIRRFITSLPAQVLRQQPVYFTDAYGLEVPFHLEFVYSSEILRDWLIRRFSEDKDKIMYGEFALEDSKTGRRLCLEDQWATMFYPGMRVVMDMVYNVHAHSDLAEQICPACDEALPVGDDRNTCKECGVYCYRPIRVEAFWQDSRKTVKHIVISGQVTLPFLDSSVSNAFSTKIRKPTPFRRIRIEVPNALVPLAPHAPLWLTSALEKLHLKYPTDNFSAQMMFTTVDSINQTVCVVEKDPPWPAGTAGSYLPHILCFECDPKFGFYPVDQREVARFESHLRDPVHRLFVEQRVKLSRLGFETLDQFAAPNLAWRRPRRYTKKNITTAQYVLLEICCAPESSQCPEIIAGELFGQLVYRPYHLGTKMPGHVGNENFAKPQPQKHKKVRRHDKKPKLNRRASGGRSKRQTAKARESG